MKKLYLLYIILFTCLAPLHAQDIHFSQFYTPTILNNPALTGIFNEDYKVGVLYRSQWGSVAVPFKTELIDLETKFQVNSVNDYLSIGFLGYADKAGTINFNTNAFYGAINYNKSLNDKYSSYLSAGFTAGYIQRSIDFTKATFDYQYQNGDYNANNGTGEQQVPNPKINNWDLGAGISFSSSLDADNKINYFIGAAGYHFTGIKTSFYSGSSVDNLSPKLVGNAGVDYNFDETYAVKIYINYLNQGSYQELVAGGVFKWAKIDAHNSQSFILSGGVYYRLKDAFLPTFIVNYKGTALTLSYDVNTSTLSPYTNLRGAFEISLFKSGMYRKDYNDKHACLRF
jgi:type IX secretion system PorP/SprF family membrane protein